MSAHAPLKFEELIAGRWLEPYQYQSFDPVINTLLERASRALAELDAEQLAPEKRDDWTEVQNYVQAINEAIAGLETVPLSNRLLKQTHAILMQGVRGEMPVPI